ncbi:hypothetical protein BROUX41_000110 [Berkeleyomyces rouxiae]|uniref:uncharacterized protein n=1 Tax=Berkeleyomyces rouxiae TaxID=2035830 RepID=UPI003B7A5A89
MASLSRRLYKTVHLTLTRESRLSRTSTRRWNSSLSSRFTLFLDPALDKPAAVKQLTSLVPKPTSSSNAAVVLTTPAFARWLEDESFMSRLLGPFSTDTLQVLSGVVDGLSSPSTFSAPCDGFSVLRGNAATLLPHLWLHDSPQAQKPERSHGYLDIHAQTASGPVTTTLPLANTIFFTGREATLSASRWVSQNGALNLQNTMDKAYQKICLPGPLVSEGISAPLIPILPPRKITGCLGNILSEIEVGGKRVPASTELEFIVPRIYSHRMAASPEATGVEVWALVSPEASPASCCLPPDVVSVFSDRENETAVAALTSNDLRSLFQDQCEVYRIESGGGGWGKRKGRLALETKWKPASSPSLSSAFASPHDDQDIDLPAFMRRGIMQRGLITPGSWLQFFISPLPSHSPAVSRLVQPIDGFVFGSAQNSLQDHAATENREPGHGTAQLVNSHFSALAAEGLYIAKDNGSSMQLESPFASLTLRPVQTRQGA